MPRPKRERRAAGSASSGPAPLEFSARNAVLCAAGVAALVLGYWLLAQGSVTMAPLLLVLGYVVLLPLAILL